MFRRNPPPLLFTFKKPVRMSIHSFFVRKSFLAIWIMNNKIIDKKIIRPWKLSVRPKNEFNHLLEIPFYNTDEIFGFLDGVRKI